MPTDPAPGFSEARDEQLINSWSCKQTLSIFMVKWQHPSTSQKQHIFIQYITFLAQEYLAVGTIKIIIFWSKIN